MKITLSFLFALTLGVSQAQHSIEKIWESDTTLAVPESVLFDKTILYVSLIDGQPWDVDGKGEIAKVDTNGKIVNATWVTGLNAPKGMGIWDKKLYVADVSEVVVINTATGKIESKIAVDGATGLNDITIDKKGVVYVSDSKLGRVHQIKKGKAELYLSDLRGVNGLKAVDNDLYLLTANDVFKTGADKKLVTVATTEMGGDGIEPVGNGDFVVSCWPGLVYYLEKDGKLTTLLDTREQKRNTADIGYNAAERIVYVPTFFKKSIVAYKLK
ncbi:SMP-30/gluconolactonase/LRE family protein [Chryseolinea lacunae]|uniref:ATP/GTP-binding protein n=1 Tax=Chryseolinea lacunae TaxID=2801331 RepID=A0ABS1KPC2_9BACT|nr:ATP/GTP-binding protein [Chryseolinea lacunae]MBL0740542.1 ATP/GTP-binding protein [Chryseolinea lacunae]